MKIDFNLLNEMAEQGFPYAVNTELYRDILDSRGIEVTYAGRASMRDAWLRVNQYLGLALEGEQFAIAQVWKTRIEIETVFGKKRYFHDLVCTVAGSEGGKSRLVMRPDMERGVVYR